MTRLHEPALLVLSAVALAAACVSVRVEPASSGAVTGTGGAATTSSAVAGAGGMGGATSSTSGTGGEIDPAACAAARLAEVGLTATFCDAPLWVVSLSPPPIFGSARVAVDAQGNAVVTRTDPMSALVEVSRWDPSGSLVEKHAVSLPGVQQPFHSGGKSLALAADGTIAIVVQGHSETLWAMEYYVAVINADGTLRFVRSLVKAMPPFVWTGVAFDPSGNILVSTDAGAQGQVTIVDTPPGNVPPLVAKLDPSGDVAWVASLGVGLFSSQITALAVDSGGDVFVGGAYLGSATFAGVDLPASTDWTGVLAKLDAQGSALWLRTYDVGAGLGFLRAIGSILPEPDGGAALLGVPYSWGTGPQPDAPSFFARADAQGAITVSRVFGAEPNVPTVLSIDAAAPLDGSGAVFIAGNVDLGLCPHPPPIYNGYFAKLDAAGQATCVMRLPAGMGSVGFLDAAARPGGGTYLIGRASQWADLGTGPIPDPTGLFLVRVGP